MEKPNEIIQLEKKMDMFLTEKNKKHGSLVPENRNTYELDSNNKIVGLNVSFNQLSDLSAIKKMTSLISLSLEGNQISDISFLEKLTNLTSLNLGNNQIADISCLIHLKNIIYLDMGGNKISNWAILADMKRLRYLYLDNCQIDDSSFLENHTSLKALHISRNPISDSSYIKKLKNLDSLSLGNTKILDYTFIKELTELSFLFLHNNKIKDITFLSALSNLEVLNLSRNSISDISPIKKLRKLKMLTISENMVEDISALGKLNDLKNLHIGGNPVSSISHLKGLTKIEKLYIQHTRISSVIYLKGLVNLTDLDLSENRIKNWSAIKECKKLERLNLQKCNISDISFLEQIYSLSYLDLSKNQIWDIGSIKDLVNLQYVDLNHNLIRDIRPLLGLIKKGVPVGIEIFDGIDVDQNPLEFPPVQVVRQGSSAVMRFFEKIDREGTDTIFEAKLTLVGEGSAGKTSLLKRLLNPKSSLPHEKNRTRGISIIDWEFKKQRNKKHIAHVWDFGGQDVYYPVHRFFLTENSVFVLLASSRQNTHHFDYWIPTIFQFGGRSPIILGQTCHDGNTTPWNDIGVYIANENFNIIKDHSQNYHEINLPNSNKGLSQIKKSIISQIISLPHYKKSVPKSWLSTKDFIDGLRHHNCISYLELKEKIQKSNPDSYATKDEVEDCVRFFHSIGMLLWYDKEEKLRNWVVLNPKWAVDAVYKIIDDERISKQKGIILSKDFDRVWTEKIYDDKHAILKDMLEIFKIAFPKRHNKLDYIMPTRLQSMSSESIWSETESCLTIVYKYEFMPKGMVNQISAELSRYISADDQVWNNGVNFCNGETSAQVFEDFYNRKIILKAKGKDARSLIVVIMNAVKDITDGYKGVVPKIIIPCSCKECLKQNEPTVFTYDQLLTKFEKDEQAKVTCNISDETFKIDLLLFNIGLPNPIKERKEELEKKKKAESKISPTRIFISYAKENKKEVNDFLMQIAPFKLTKEVQTWHCSELELGKQWELKIKEEFYKADIILYFVSTYFFSTPFILDEEVRRGIDRFNNPNDKVALIPIILDKIHWEDLLGEFSSNFKGKPINLYEKSNNAWFEVVDDLKRQYFRKPNPNSTSVLLGQSKEKMKSQEDIIDGIL